VSQEISSPEVNLAALEGWRIVIPEKPISSEAFAAREFQHFFNIASGVNLPIITPAIPHPSNADETWKTGQRIFIGSHKAMQKTSQGSHAEGFVPEDFSIIIRENTITISGGTPRGTLYCVYTFLET